MGKEAREKVGGKVGIQWGQGRGAEPPESSTPQARGSLGLPTCPAASSSDGIFMNGEKRLWSNKSQEKYQAKKGQKERKAMNGN